MSGQRRTWIVLAAGVLPAVLFLGAVGMWFGWLGPRLRIAQARRAVRETGGQLTSQQILTGPYLRGTTGYIVDLSKSGLDDRQLARLTPHLRHLEEAGSLRYLNLRGTRVSGAGLRRLRKVERLRAVDVTETPVTAADVEWLCRRMPGLRVLDNSGPRAWYHEGCRHLAFSADGRQLALAGPRGLLLLDCETGARQRLELSRLANFVDFSPDGTLLAISQTSGVSVRELPALRERVFLPFRSQSPTAVVFASNRRELYVAEFSTVLPYSLNRGETAGGETGRALWGESRYGLLIGRSRNLPGVQLFDRVETMVHPDLGVLRGKAAEFPPQPRVGIVSGDGSRAAAWWSSPASSPKVHLIDLATGREVSRVGPPPGPLLCGSFNRDASRLALGTSEGHVIVHELATATTLLAVRDRAGAAIQVTLSADGRRVAAAFELGSLKWWPVPAAPGAGPE